MRLLIISPTAHYIDKEGALKGHGATVKEISYLATLFEHITHIAPLYKGTPPKSFLSYTSDNIEFLPVLPAGGKNLTEKLKILLRASGWITTIKNTLKNRAFDLIHLRTPSSFSLVVLSFFKLSHIKTLKWIKFAGNWEDNSAESLAAKLQKRIIKSGIYSSFVSVNYIKDLPNKNFIPFPNPSYYLSSYLEHKNIIQEKKLSSIINIAFVGNLYREKGIMESLHIIKELLKKGIDLRFHIVGSGGLENMAREYVLNNNLDNKVIFHGPMPHEKVFDILKDSHFFLFPSYTEGWPKVLNEAMSMGAVPISSNVSIIPDVLSACNCGFYAPYSHINAFVDGIIRYIEQPDLWKTASQNAYRYAVFFTYEYYGLKLTQVLNQYGFKVDEQRFEHIKNITKDIQFPI